MNDIFIKYYAEKAQLETVPSEIKNWLSELKRREELKQQGREKKPQ